MSSEALVSASDAGMAARMHALRIAGGVAVPFVLGEFMQWPLSCLGAIFALQLLAPRSAPMSFRRGVAAVIGLGAAFAAALVLTRLLLPYPTAFALGVGLAVFAGFFAQARSGSPLAFFFLVGVAMTALIGTASDPIAADLAKALVGGMAVAVATSWLMHAAFPDPQPAPPATVAGPSPAIAARAALAGTLAFMPLLLLMLAQQSEAMVVTVTALAVLKAADPTEGNRAALGLVAANVLAGVAAIVAYAAIMLAPTLPVLAFVVLLVGLLLGARIAAGGGAAGLFVAAGSAALILLGLGLTPFGDTGTAFTTRIVYVVAASVYAVGAAALVQPLRRP